ncbi:MAG: hypothetical protein ACTHL8_19645 [Burkholderiaceae bacterium]
MGPAALAVAAIVLASPAGAAPDGCDAAGRAIPPRAASAPSGSEFARAVAGLSGPARDGAVLDQVRAGNVPEHLRHAKAVTLTAADRPGRVTVCVLPDYLAVGSDADYVLVPLGLRAALALAAELGFELPTTRVVDAVYRQAAVHLDPRPLPAGDEMRSTAYLLRHNAIVQAQRASQAGALDDLAAGSKKDLVLTRRLWEMPGRVAIYGWHRLDGRPIQPLSLVHGARYADYSHGVRLVWSTAWLDGRPRRLEDLLSRPQTAGWFSDEGAIPLLERREQLVAAADPP